MWFENCKEASSLSEFECLTSEVCHKFHLFRLICAVTIPSKNASETMKTVAAFYGLMTLWVYDCWACCTQLVCSSIGVSVKGNELKMVMHLVCLRKDFHHLSTWHCVCLFVLLLLDKGDFKTLMHFNWKVRFCPKYYSLCLTWHCIVLNCLKVLPVQ